MDNTPVPPNPQASYTNPQPTPTNSQPTHRSPQATPTHPQMTPNPQPFSSPGHHSTPQAVATISQLKSIPLLFKHSSLGLQPTAPHHVQIKLYLVEVFHNYCPVSVLKFRCTCSIKSSDYNTSVQKNSTYFRGVCFCKSANKGSCEFLICCDVMELKSPLKLLGSEVIEIEKSENFTLDICFLQHTKPLDQLQILPMLSLLSPPPKH